MAVRYERFDAVAVITLDRPRALNAINAELCRELAEAWERFAAEDDAAVAIVTGAGRAFCAGKDMKESAEAVRTGQSFQPVDLTNPIEIPKPIIAAVNGPAAGGGVVLAVNCDIAICAETAVFTLPFAALGIGAVKMVLELGQRIGFNNAMYLALAAPRVDAPTALRLGLVQEVLSSDDLMPRAFDLAEKIAGYSAPALRAIKTQMRRAIEVGYAEALRELGEQPVVFTADTHEGTLAFDEKRRARFKA